MSKRFASATIAGTTYTAADEGLNEDWFVFSENLHTGEKTYITTTWGARARYLPEAARKQAAILNGGTLKNTAYRAESAQKTERDRAIASYIDSYLEYRNNFLSIDGYAEYHMFTVHETLVLVNKGRVLHQDKFGHH